MLYDQNVSETDIDFMDTRDSKRFSPLREMEKKKGGKEISQIFQYGENLDPRESNFNTRSPQLRQERQPFCLPIFLFN